MRNDPEGISQNISEYKILMNFVPQAPELPGGVHNKTRIDEYSNDEKRVPINSFYFYNSLERDEDDHGHDEET